MYHILPTELQYKCLNLCLWSDYGKSVPCTILCMATQETAMDCMKHTVSRISRLHLTVCMLVPSLVGEWTQLLVACNKVETEVVCVGSLVPSLHCQLFFLHVGKKSGQHAKKSWQWRLGTRLRVGTCYVRYFLLDVICSSAWDA